ncbi:MAG: hypothetical protein ABL921_00325 [Pirellula sp.]
MDVAPTLERCRTVMPDRARHVPLRLFQSFSLGIFASFSCNLHAQVHTISHAVQVAVEPNFVGLLAPAPRASVTTPSTLIGAPSNAMTQGVEPERIPPPKKIETASKDEAASKRSSNFLPPQRPIGQVSIDLRSKPKGGSNVLPENLAQKALGELPVVQAAASTEMLDPTIFEHRHSNDELVPYQPLYFEEVNLERYGRGCGPLQPALSGARFFATIPSLPYAMAVHHPSQTYTFKWPYEAGWGAPKVRELQPLQWKPMVVQAGAVTGLLFVVP